MSCDILVVGGGFAGCVSARQLADAGYKVLLVERRGHIGGNAYDEPDAHGILVHRYGPHIFHTNADSVVEWLSQFTAWRRYEHRVLAQVRGQLLPIPINRTTLNRLYGLDLDEAGVAEFLANARQRRDPVLTSEDAVLNSVGPELADLFFRGYTRKQWGLELSQLSAGVAARIPVRTGDDDRYFTDRFQAMPAEGYTVMFQRMLDHANIDLRIATEYQQVVNSRRWAHVVYTGPVDAYFDYRFGRLPYRSLRFEHMHLKDVDCFQPVGTVNFPNDHDYTRITEFKHLTGQVHAGTSLVREYPQAGGEPFYPIPRPENEELYQRYKALAEEEKSVTFVGRLAQYRYYNMDQVVAAALAATDRLLKRGT